MGFYGNVSNITRSTFQFDKIYSNRFMMDLNADYDNIYVGRYVLVEYDQHSSFDVFQRVYIKTQNVTATTQFYIDKEQKTPIVGKKDKYYFVAKDNNNLIDTKRPYESVLLLKCLEDGASKFGSAPEEGKEKEIGFEIVTNIETSLDEYSINYKLDYEKYGNSRGYDSTVWMKTYSGDKIQYVNIAELNTVVPTFVVTGDAPSDSPIQPHFDIDSTNVYYNLHMPTSWGVRIKESNDGYSDEKITWNEMKLNIPLMENSNYPDIHRITIKQLESTKDGAIYYNKAGFNKNYKSHVYLDDRITLDNAYSGNIYPTHDKTQSSKMIQPDTKEISIMLPSLGNTVSDMWDIVYGEDRNLDIQWNSLEGTRLIKENQNEYGYNYFPESASTFASIINSTHDLMGMIIDTEENLGVDAIILEDKDVNDSNRQKYENGLAAAVDSNIYYSNSNKEFYIKDVTYDYIEAKKDVDSSLGYSEIDLTPWEPNKYYYKVSENQYNQDISPRATLNRIYYNVEINKEDVEEFEFNKYYKRDGNNYKLVNELTDANISLQSNLLYTFTSEPKESITPNETEFYQKDTYYYLKGETLTPDSANSLTPGREYYKISFVMEDGKIIFDENGQAKIEARQIKLVNFVNNMYYNKIDDDYIVLTYPNNLQKAYNLSPELTTCSGFYYQEDNPWWYKESNKLIKMKQETLDDKYDNLYRIAVQEIEDTFYTPGYYYYEEIINEKKEIKKVLDYNSEKQNGIQYYIYNGLYVIEDTLNRYSKGAQWLYDYNQKPDTLTLGIRQLKYHWKKLKGFARNYNTIHGLILGINNLIRKDDQLTRDNQTVQGAINTLNDIIGKFDSFNMSNIMMVNNYGQVVTTSLQENRWVSNVIDGTVGEHFIELAHKYRDTTSYSGSRDEASSKANMDFADIAGNKGTYIDSELFDSSYVSDKNKSKSNQSGSGINGTNDDTLKIYTPVIDATGHVVGRNLETVTLPYGFKTVSVVNNDSTGTANTESITKTDSNVVADNTKDTLTISTANKWLRFTTTSTTDVITVAHEIHSINTTKKSNTDLNNGSTTSNFTVQDISYDNAGHLTAVQSHTYTMPYGYRDIQVINKKGNANTTLLSTTVTTTVSADTSQDTFSIENGNVWIRLSATDETSNNIKIYHETHDLTTNDATASINLTSSTSQTFELHTYNFDDAGHLDGTITTTVTIPNNYGIFTDGTSQGTTTASGSQDTMTISDDNYNIFATVSKDTITINHASAQTATQCSTGSSTISYFGDSFTVPNVFYDNNGHIKSTSTYTVTIPALEAQGDNWITLTVSNSNKVVAQHKAPLTVNVSTTINSAQSPSFGATFNIPVVKYDSNGHISSVGTNTVKIPEPSLTDNGSGNIITDLSLTKSTNAIVASKANVGSLALTGYTSDTKVTDTIVKASDTVNQAFSALELQLNKALNRIAELEKAISNLITENDDGSVTLETPEFSEEETN